MFKFDDIYFKKAVSDEIHRAFDIPSSKFCVSSTELLLKCKDILWTESYEIAIPEVVEDNTTEDSTDTTAQNIMDMLFSNNRQLITIHYMLQVEVIKDEYDDVGWVAFSLNPVAKNNITRITKKQKSHFIRIKPTIASWRFQIIDGKFVCSRLGDEVDENTTLENLINDNVTKNEIRIMKEHVQIVDTFIHDLAEYLIELSN